MLMLTLLLLFGFVSCNRWNHLKLHLFDQQTDHFNFARSSTFPQRVFIDETFFVPNGTILFYTGNEAPIDEFVNNTGFMFELAPQLKAMVVFAEHRFYGESFPFGIQNAFNATNIGLLSIEQAIADFSTIGVWLKQRWNSKRSPIIAFGGSYGGVLSLFCRMKQPNVFAGAIASSAPPLKSVLRSDSNQFYEIVTQAYGNVSSSCPQLVRHGWQSLYANGQSTAGRLLIQKELNLCAPPTNHNDIDDLYGFITGALETMVQYGYPYPTHFDNPVPGYPFKATCLKMLKAHSSLEALRSAMEVYYNFTGQAGNCFNVGTFKRSLFGAKLNLNSGPGDAWPYQTCTEVYQPIPINANRTMFLGYQPNEQQIFAQCQSKFGVVPRPNWEELHFWGDSIAQGLTNVVLSTGQLDPWRAGAIVSCPKCSSSVEMFEIEHAAHHLDLRESNPLDPRSVTNARLREKSSIQRWIAEWHSIYQQ